MAVALAGLAALVALAWDGPRPGSGGADRAGSPTTAPAPTRPAATTTTAAPPPVVVLVLGDSIAGSTFLGAERPVRGGWPGTLGEVLAGRVDVRNEAVGGVTLALDGLHDDIPSVRTSFAGAVRAAGAGVVLVAAGRNDLHHATDEALREATDDIARQAVGLGVRVLFATLLPVSTAYGARDLTEPQRVRFNAFLRERHAGALVDADRAVDPAGTGLLAPAVDGGDGFHLNPEGSRRVAEAAAAALVAAGAVAPR